MMRKAQCNCKEHLTSECYCKSDHKPPAAKKERTDTERLDFLSSDIDDVGWTKKSWIMHGREPQIVCCPAGDKWPGERATTETLREAIDKAMDAEGK